MSTPEKNNKKIVLGKKTAEGYEYAARIDFGKDISSQISKVVKEKEINELLKKKIKELKETIEKFSQKEKNLHYYYELGKKLLFLDTKPFKQVARYSIFRRIKEELPEILPKTKDQTVTIKHLDFMYCIAHISKNELSKASWDQWYEIMKFKGIYKNPKLLKKILNECKSGISGPSLRAKIKIWRKKNLKKLKS
jgi:Rad3-related DNA helicase